MNQESFSRERTASVLEEPDIQKLIAYRHIRSEDMRLIEELASFSGDLLNRELHNFFNLNQEKSAEMLKQQVQHAQDEIQKALYETFLLFAEKYNWMACYHLERELERRK